MGGGVLWRDNQQSAFAHIHKSSSRSTTSPWSPILYPHCASSSHRPRAGDVTRARCARRHRVGRGKSKEDNCKVVKGRDGQGAMFGKVGPRYDKQSS